MFCRLSDRSVSYVSMFNAASCVSLNLIRFLVRFRFVNFSRRAAVYFS